VQLVAAGGEARAVHGRHAAGLYARAAPLRVRRPRAGVGRRPRARAACRPRRPPGVPVPVKFIPTKLPGVLLIEPDVFLDPRGFSLETYHRDKYRQGGIELDFVQDNHSRSTRGTLRGLHAQWRKPQGKLVRVLQGEIWDVAVDARKGSP